MSESTMFLLFLTTLLVFLTTGACLNEATPVDDTASNNGLPETSAKLTPVSLDTVSTATEQVIAVSIQTQTAHVDSQSVEPFKEAESLSSQVSHHEPGTQETELFTNNDKLHPSSICTKQELTSDNSQLDASTVTKSSVSTEEPSSVEREEVKSENEAGSSVFEGELNINPTLTTTLSESTASLAPSGEEPVQQQLQGDNSADEDSLVKDTLEDVKEFIKETSEKKEAEPIPEKQHEESSQTKGSEIKVPQLPPISIEAVEHNVELPIVEMGGREVQTPDEKTELSGKGGEKREDSTKESPQPGDTPDDEQEEFPSFGEWTAKVLAEEEKTKLELEILGNIPGGAVQPKTVKQSRNNYASRECGAKILAMNPEAKNTKSILNGNKDDYMTNPCTAKKWFTVELCEPIQVRTFELASFELFSSQLKTFKVLLSDRYPAKEWRLVGTFAATEERATQSFQVEDEHFSKFVKVEMVDHFRAEHFCPLTLFRVFGVDLNYLSDDDDSGADVPTSQDPDSGDIITQEEEAEGEIPTNLFESAKDTVISLVKKVLKVEGTEEAAVTKDSKNDTANTTSSEALIGENVTNEGIPLPCIPDVQIPVSNVTTEDESGEINATSILPEPPYPETTVSSNMVIKLEDHEQPPSQDKITQPLVTLIDWKYEDIIGNQHFAASCSTCHKTTKSFSEGRQHCRYFDLLLGNHYGKQSCPKSKPKQKQKSKDLKVKEPEIIEATSNFVESTIQEVYESVVKNKDGEVSADTQSSFSPDVTSSKSDPDFIVVSSVPQSNDVDGPNKQSPVLENEKEQTLIISQSSIVVSPSLGSSVIDEPIISPQYSSTSISVEPSSASVSGTDETTYYPQPGQVVIPTPSQTELPNNLEDSSSIDTVADQRDTVSSSEQISDKAIELEPSYKSPSVILSEGTLNKDDLSSSTMTPELPPLTDDSVVGIEQQAGRETDLKVNVEIDENLLTTDQTEPPPEVTTEPVPIQATVVGESVTGSKGDQPINKTENGAGGEPKRDLNLVRVPVSPLMKRESAMMRLNNRLKALEVNVSLSSRFLEELSKRYRKQSDEVMKLLNKTISKLNHTTKMVEEKDEENREIIGVLEARIDNLTSIVTQLVNNVGQMDEKLSKGNLTWMILEAVIVGLLMIMSWRRNQNPYITPELQKLLEKMPSGPKPPTPRKRRASSTGTVGHSAPQLTLIKHSSESALDVQTDFHIVEPLPSVSSDIKPEGHRKKKKKKQKNWEINQDHYSKETPPILTSSTNQQYSSTYVGGVNGPGEEGLRLMHSCPSFKPRSNSHSGQIKTFHSDSVINGSRKKLGSDSGSESSTSLSKEPYIVDMKPPLQHTQSAKRLPHAHTFPPPPPPKISKSLSQKSLVHSNFNRNAALKKQNSEPWHHRAQSDGSVKFDPMAPTFTTETTSGPSRIKQRNRDSNNPRPLDPGGKRYILSKMPENLHATNGNTPTSTTDSVESQPTNQSNTGRKWSLGVKLFSIK